MKSIDMSPEAVSRRMRAVANLYRAGEGFVKEAQASMKRQMQAEGLLKTASIRVAEEPTDYDNKER